MLNDKPLSEHLQLALEVLRIPQNTHLTENLRETAEQIVLRGLTPPTTVSLGSGAFYAGNPLIFGGGKSFPLPERGA